MPRTKGMTSLKTLAAISACVRALFQIRSSSIGCRSGATHRSGHLGLHAGRVCARAREGLFDLVHEDDNPWCLLPGQHGTEEALDVVATADIGEGLATAPNREAWSLLHGLSLALP